MPLVRIDHAAGKPPGYRAAISKSVHDAMTSTFNVPDDDRFQIIGEHVANPGLRREDVFVNLVEVEKENWSFGNGLAQYAG
jgi:4-oxalocrotonate tautomerase